MEPVIKTKGKKGERIRVNVRNKDIVKREEYYC